MSRDRTGRASSRAGGPRRVLQPLRRLVRGQLRLRVLIAVVSVILVALAAFDVAAVTALRSYLMNQVDTTLGTAALLNSSRIAAAPPGALRALGVEVVSSGGVLVEPESMAEWLAPVNGPLYQYTLLFWPDNEQPVTLEVSDTVLSTKPKDFNALSLDGSAQTALALDGTAQVRVVAVRARGGIVIVSSSLDHVNRIVDRMWLIVLIGSAAAVLLIGVCVFWLLWRGLRPIETMAAQADWITAGDLTDRVGEQDPRSEVGRLGSALNGMLARIEASVHEREAGQELMRQFFADASHELRTPLASLRANAELYQQGALPEREQVDEVMRRIALEAQRLSGLVDDMLGLARLDQHPDQHREPVELSELVASCVDRMRVAAPEHVWHTEIVAGVITVGDEELLRRAVDNLLANVRAHTPPGTAATVALRDRDDIIEIEVMDTGPGVPDDRLPRIFDRFYRADTAAPRPGSGLGLAIVNQIAVVHNGFVLAEPNSPHGLRLLLTLPAVYSLELTQDSHNSPATV